MTVAHAVHLEIGQTIYVQADSDDQTVVKIGTVSRSTTRIGVGAGMAIVHVRIEGDFLAFRAERAHTSPRGALDAAFPA